MTSSLPDSILEMVEMTPIEDLMLSLLRAKLPDVSVQTLVRADQNFPFVLIRSGGSWGAWTGDDRFIDASTFDVHVFCLGVNADQDAALLSEAVRVAIRDSRNIVVPGLGYLMEYEMLDRPSRSPDWATSVGPVQYADLPTGVERWEASYDLTIRRPADKPYTG